MDPEFDECQRQNPPPRKPQAPLGTIKAHYPFETIAWDIMGQLPVSEHLNFGCSPTLPIDIVLGNILE